jgi:predicted transcriptional regulator
MRLSQTKNGIGSDLFVNIFMPTTVKIPDSLLKSVDRRATALGISRNRLVVRALEQALSLRSAWPAEFLEHLRKQATAIEGTARPVTCGKRIEDFDAAIAAHALALGATLVTVNLGHMTRFPGLRVEDWSR